ncbi:MAG: ABC transporter ATP-binding protein [bacterium]|nr:ABC transporter ATP-binding protein [bacterium]
MSNLFKKILKLLVKEKTELVLFFYRYQRKYYPLAIGAGICLLLNVLLELPMPLFTRELIDNIIPAKDLSSLNILCLVLLGIILFRQGSAFLMRYFLIKYNSRVYFDLSKNFYFHVQELPMGYFARRPSGYILARLGEVASVESVLVETFLYVVQDIVRMLVGAAMILHVHLELGLISLGLLPFFIYSIKYFHPKIKKLNKLLKEESAQYTGKVEKSINAIEKIKSAVKEETVGNRVADKMAAVIGLRVKSQVLGAVAGIAASFVGMIAPFVVLWYGGSEIIRGAMTLGDFVLINSFLGYLYGPARNLTNIGYSISQAMAGLERVYELFNEKEEDQSGQPAGEIQDIRFKDVSFSYVENTPMLKNVDLTMEKGRRTALVGESGQGKSTIVKMLMKFYNPDSGQLLFSGTDARDIAVKDLRKRIAYVSQRSRLLEEEVEENFKDPRMQGILKKMNFGKSFDNEELFQNEFSGGEVQKVEAAEAILDAADVLVVDEGTSNLDYKSERIVLDELLAKYQDKIIIFIAHRLSSVVDFEQIIVVDKGEIAEQGTHSELLAKEGKYNFLWGLQQGKKSA